MGGLLHVREMIFSLLLQQFPAYLAYLTWMSCYMLGTWFFPYFSNSSQHILLIWHGWVAICKGNEFVITSSTVPRIFCSSDMAGLLHVREMSLSLLLQQFPEYFAHLIWVGCYMLGKCICPYFSNSSKHTLIIWLWLFTIWKGNKFAAGQTYTVL